MWTYFVNISLHLQYDTVLYCIGYTNLSLTRVKTMLLSIADMKFLCMYHSIQQLGSLPQVLERTSLNHVNTSKKNQSI